MHSYFGNQLGNSSWYECDVVAKRTCTLRINGDIYLLFSLHVFFYIILSKLTSLCWSSLPLEVAPFPFPLSLSYPHNVGNPHSHRHFTLCVRPLYTNRYCSNNYLLHNLPVNSRPMAPLPFLGNAPYGSRFGNGDGWVYCENFEYQESNREDFVCRAVLFGCFGTSIDGWCLLCYFCKCGWRTPMHRVFEE